MFVLTFMCYFSVILIVYKKYLFRVYASRFIDGLLVDDIIESLIRSHVFCVFLFFLFLFIKFQILFCKCLSVPLVPYFTSTDSQKKFEISDVRFSGITFFIVLKGLKKGWWNLEEKCIGFFYFSSVQLWTLELKPATFESFQLPS